MELTLREPMLATQPQGSAVLTEASELLTSLPYVDTVPAAVQKRVNSLIEAEMAAMPPRDYLSHRPLPRLHLLGTAADPESAGPSIALGELQRLTEGRPSVPLDRSRYNVDPPEGALRREPQAWRTALSNCRAQLEHQQNQLVNLELLQNFGSAAWLQHNRDLARMRDALVGAAHEDSAANEALNLKRKMAQQEAAPEITRLNADYSETIAKNQQIETACALLKVDIKRLKQTLGEEGGESAEPGAAPEAGGS